MASQTNSNHQTKKLVHPDQAKPPEASATEPSPVPKEAPAIKRAYEPYDHPNVQANQDPLSLLQGVNVEGYPHPKEGPGPFVWIGLCLPSGIWLNLWHMVDEVEATSLGSYVPRKRAVMIPHTRVEIRGWQYDARKRDRKLMLAGRAAEIRTVSPSGNEYRLTRVRQAWFDQWLDQHHKPGHPYQLIENAAMIFHRAKADTQAHAREMESGNYRSGFEALEKVEPDEGGKIHTSDPRLVRIAPKFIGAEVSVGVGTFQR
jgi:hypothetical protein